MKSKIAPFAKQVALVFGVTIAIACTPLSPDLKLNATGDNSSGVESGESVITAQDWDKAGWTLKKESVLNATDWEAPPAPLKYQIPEISVVLVADSGWSLKQAEVLIKEAMQIWQQCSLKIAKVRIFEVASKDRKVSWERFAKGKGSLNELRKKTPVSNQLVIFLFESFADDLEGSGLSHAVWINSDVFDKELENTVYVTSVVNTEKYQQEREEFPYNILAHEMLHVLTKMGSHYNVEPANLANIWRNRSNLILPKFCKAIETNPLIAPN